MMLRRSQACLVAANRRSTPGLSPPALTVPTVWDTATLFVAGPTTNPPRRQVCGTMAAMTVESSLKTLHQLRTTRRPPVLMLAASFLWTRQNTASLADLKAALDIDATLDTIDAALRIAAEERYDELLQWCIRTTARLDGTTVRNPSVWLLPRTCCLRCRSTEARGAPRPPACLIGKSERAALVFEQYRSEFEEAARNRW